MSFKAHILVPAVHRFAYISGVSATLARRDRSGRILMFHEVDDRLYSAKTFEAQLTYLLRHFRIVSLESLVLRASDPDRSPTARPEIALTFDDGLRNHYTVVYPALAKLGVPATFFVCPGLIEERRWQWCHEVLARLETMSNVARVGLARELNAPTESTSELKEWMKRLPKRSRQEIEKRIRELTPGFEPTEDQRIRCDPMSWEELVSLDASLITVGSHTVNHPMLTSLDSEDVCFEIQNSRRWLEEKLRRPVDYFCYPNGAYNELAVRRVRESYQAAVTDEPGFVCAGGDPHLLRRVPVASELPRFAWCLHDPEA